MSEGAATPEQYADWQRVHYGLMSAEEYRAKYPQAARDFPGEARVPQGDPS